MELESFVVREKAWYGTGSQLCNYDVGKMYNKRLI